MFKTKNQKDKKDYSYDNSRYKKDLEQEILKNKDYIDSLTVEIESIKLLYYLYQDFINKTKSSLDSLFTIACNNNDSIYNNSNNENISCNEYTMSLINTSISNIEEMNNNINIMNYSISQEIEHYRIQIEELKSDLEDIEYTKPLEVYNKIVNNNSSNCFKENNTNYSLKVQEDEIFVLNQKLVSLEHQLIEINNKIKEYKKEKDLYLKIQADLLYRDPNNLNKILEAEVNNIRDYITRITKTINYYKNKKSESDKVIESMEEMYSNIEKPKKIQVIKKKSLSHRTDETPNDNYTNISSVNFDANKFKLKKKLESLIKELEEVKNDYNLYYDMNNKIENDNIKKSSILSKRFDEICKLELELELLKDKENKLN